MVVAEAADGSHAAPRMLSRKQLYSRADEKYIYEKQTQKFIYKPRAVFANDNGDLLI